MENIETLFAQKNEIIEQQLELIRQRMAQIESEQGPSNPQCRQSEPYTSWLDRPKRPTGTAAPQSEAWARENNHSLFY